MTVGEAKSKGLPPCSRCKTDYTPKTEFKATNGDVIVYHNPGKKRVHIIGCRRLTTDPAELATFTKMTLAEARDNGLPPCSRCPGSNTPGKGNPPPK